MGLGRKSLLENVFDEGQRQLEELGDSLKEALEWGRYGEAEMYMESIQEWIITLRLLNEQVN